MSSPLAWGWDIVYQNVSRLANNIIYLFYSRISSCLEVLLTTVLVHINITKQNMYNKSACMVNNNKRSLIENVKQNVINYQSKIFKIIHYVPYCQILNKLSTNESHLNRIQKPKLNFN